MEQVMERIILTKKDQIGTITLNDPTQLNGISRIMIKEFIDAFQELEYDDDIRVIVINGKGKAFSGGGAMDMLTDIGNETKSGSVPPEEFDMRYMNEWPRLIRNSWKPVIASVRGACAGGAIGVALCADFCICSDTALFREPFIDIAIIPDVSGTYSLTRHVNARKATQYIMLGDRIKADQALEVGIANWVVPDAELEAETEKLCQKLIAKPKNAIKMSKQFINMCCWNQLEDELRMEWITNSLLTNSVDFREGVDAFVNKRKPEFNKR